MPPLFRNPPLIQNYYIVGVSDSAEPVCNYNYRAVLVKFFEIAHYRAFIGRIERVGSFVHKKIVGFLQ